MIQECQKQIILPHAYTYQQRAELCTNPTAKKLFNIMDQKKTNLGLATDVTTKKELLYLADLLGPYICVFKTHIDIIIDFDQDLLDQLQHLSKKHNFVIFEDRKFADIGNTVVHQYQSGLYHIVDWADIVNAHTLPGAGIIEGLRAVGLHKGRGLLLIAQMSSAQNFITTDYTHATVILAQRYADFVIGLIAQEKLIPDERFVHMTPGVQLHKSNDNLGQQYNTPAYVIGTKGSDIILVGRGIYQADDPLRAAQEYRKQGWQAYEESFSSIE